MCTHTDRLKLLPHLLHGYGFSPVCIRWWLTRSDDWLKLLLQSLDEYSFFPECILWCVSKFAAWLKHFPHFLLLGFLTCMCSQVIRKCWVLAKAFSTFIILKCSLSTGYYLFFPAACWFADVHFFASGAYTYACCMLLLSESDMFLILPVSLAFEFRKTFSLVSEVDVIEWFRTCWIFLC